MVRTRYRVGLRFGFTGHTKSRASFAEWVMMIYEHIERGAIRMAHDDERIDHMRKSRTTREHLGSVFFSEAVNFG
jgi:hypothetical protein